MNQSELEKKVQQYALKFQIKKLFPAAVVGARNSRYSFVGKSGFNPSEVIFGKLRERLLSIGNLYERHNGNFVGCCAEVQAANKVLFKSPYTDLDKIKFSNAIRPRTMQVIKTCANCKFTFE